MTANDWLLMVSWRNDDGEWEEFGYVDGPIETKPLGCWNYGYPLPTLTEFSGTLTFDTPVETRTYLRRLVVVWSRDLAGRSAMHSAYRAKTRRRNRRRK